MKKYTHKNSKSCKDNLLNVHKGSKMYLNNIILIQFCFGVP